MGDPTYGIITCVLVVLGVGAIGAVVGYMGGILLAMVMQGIDALRGRDK